MDSRLPVLKTYKLFINGAFPRTESGRSLPIENSAGQVVAHLCHASRKDLRDAVEAARAACDKWASATAYNRGQILYRMAEMMEGKSRELAEALAITGDVSDEEAVTEVNAAIDRVIYYAGWADKYSQVLGCNNPVSGPYYNFTVTQPTGVVGVVAPNERPLLALISLLAPVIVSGNTTVVLASERNPVPACVLAEVFATSDLPSGVVNILTGTRAELNKFFASHREIDGIHAATKDPGKALTLRTGMAENLKRVIVHTPHSSAGSSGTVTIDWIDDRCQTPYWIEPFIEYKTIWHPSST
jgi:acyl-CoA reductase-like NAD-dependent aldehyde dehydrogenase